MKNWLIFHDFVASVFLIVVIFAAASSIAPLAPLIKFAIFCATAFFTCTSIITIFSCIMYWISLLNFKEDNR
jgi:hypothetical protein